MKILYIITRSDEIGGAHIHLKDICLWMKNNGHKVHVLVGGDGIYCDMLRDNGIAHESLKYLKRPISLFNDIKAIDEIRTFIHSFDPDIVSIHSAKAGLIGRLACKKLNKPCIFTAHGWSFIDGVRFPMRQIYEHLERLAAKFNERIVTVCESDRDLAIQRKICPPYTLKTIHNGMPDIAEEYFSDPVGRPAKLIMVARFEEQKDHESLFHALSELKDLEWSIDLIGEGKLQSRYMELSNTLGLAERVNFLGRRSDIKELLSGADIFLLISLWEGFPLSILEAMRARLPVIATDTAGVREAVLHNKTGFLVPPKGVDDIKEKLKMLINDIEIRKVMGANGRSRYESNFTFDVMAAKYASLYQQIIDDYSL